jgi:hypothetical protein
MKNCYLLFFQLLLFPIAFSQNNGDGLSAVSHRDVIHLSNGVSLDCEIVEVTEDIVFYEQNPSLGLLSASLSEVKDFKLWKHNGLYLADSSKSTKRDPLYRQGKRDAKKYYKLRHKSSFQTPKNPRNTMLSNPTYAAGYQAGAKSKKARVIVALCFPLILPLTLLLSLAILSIGYSGGSGWL